METNCFGSLHVATIFSNNFHFVSLLSTSALSTGNSGNIFTTSCWISNSEASMELSRSSSPSASSSRLSVLRLLTMASLWVTATVSSVQSGVSSEDSRGPATSWQLHARSRKVKGCEVTAAPPAVTCSITAVSSCM